MKMTYPINDRYFRVEVLSKTERPNLLSYLAMHQCYSEKVIIDEIEKLSELSESELGKRVVNNCLKFGHYSVIEHPTISFCVSGFPHNVMAQATRHRHLSFSVQSQRYTCQRILDVSDSFSCDELEKVFYFRPTGFYLDREGNKYEYSQTDRYEDMRITRQLIEFYEGRIKLDGHAPEHARDLLPQNIRQDFVVTFNARSLLHFCDLRLPKDAQLEIRTLAQMLFEQFKQWMPSVAEFYEKNRYGKNKLSP
jgi:thymidylate synthase (FAD)